MVTVDKDGYEPVQTQIVSQVAGAGAAGMAGNERSAASSA